MVPSILGWTGPVKVKKWDWSGDCFCFFNEQQQENVEKITFLLFDTKKNDFKDLVEWI